MRLENDLAVAPQPDALRAAFGQRVTRAVGLGRSEFR